MIKTSLRTESTDCKTVSLETTIKCFLSRRYTLPFDVVMRYDLGPTISLTAPLIRLLNLNLNFTFLPVTIELMFLASQLEYC